ncbi:hypothetical protein EMIT0P12_10534 [Pseudomonas sp. IT-P12]
MVKHTEPDQTLIKMPSLRAVKAFVAAARYQNFTRAAEALCVTQPPSAGRSASWRSTSAQNCSTAPGGQSS